MAAKPTLIRRVKALFMALYDPRTPLYSKILVLVGFLYGAFPLDLVPDIVPVVGQMDDLGILVTVFLILIHTTKDVRSQLLKTYE